MSNPITWQNINGNPERAGGGAVNALQFAGNSFNNAFAGLQGVLDKREATDAANVVQGRKNLTQDFMNQMRQLNTVDSFNEQGGDLQRRFAAAGIGVDQAALGAAYDRQLPNLQSAATANTTFANTQITEAQRGRIEIGKALAVGGNQEGFNAFMADPANQDLRGKSDLFQLNSTAVRTFNNETRANSQEGRAVAEVGNLAAERAAASVARQQELILRQSIQADISAEKEAKRLIEVDKQLAKKLPKLAASEDGMKSLNSLVSSTKDPDTQNSMRLLLGELLGEKGMETSTATAALNGVRTGEWFGTEAGNRETLLKTALKATTPAKAIVANSFESDAPAPVVQAIDAAAMKASTSPVKQSEVADARLRAETMDVRNGYIPNLSPEMQVYSSGLAANEQKIKDVAYASKMAEQKLAAANQPKWKTDLAEREAATKLLRANLNNPAGLGRPPRQSP